MFTFIKNLLGVKTDQAVQSGLEALVRWDPKAATEAELRTMEQHLDELGTEVGRARQSLVKEQKEADAIKALSDQRLAAAESLQNQMNAANDPERRASLEKSLTQLLKLLEEMAPEIDREVKDAEDAKEFLAQLEEAYASAGAKMKQARSDLERAQRQMGRAEQQREMAERQADAAKRAAGLAGTTSRLNVALKAMQDAADKDLIAAEAANAKAKLLKPTKPEDEDPNIAAALAEAAGPKPTTVTDRLAALKNKLGK
jgi:chromosome segregation ATPase